MATFNFNDQKTEVKIGILNFLKKEGGNKVIFEFKDTIIDYLKSMEISNNFLLGNMKAISPVKEISTDEVIKITVFEQEFSIPLEYVEDVSLVK